MAPVRTIQKLGILPELIIFHCACCNDVGTKEVARLA